MQRTVQQLAAEIVAREGGYVNDPSDPGGATNHGVTIGTMRALGIDLNKDGRIDIGDVKTLSQAQAVQIYVDHYFKGPSLDKLPEPLQASVFDMYVNAGANAIKLLQRLITRLGFPCADDGLLGSQTVRQVGLAYISKPNLEWSYAVARRDYYYALADARPTSRKYARRRDGGKGGWITRAEEFMPENLRLTETQHRARVAAWK